MLLVVFHKYSGGQKSRFYSKPAFKEDRNFFCFKFTSSENSVAGEEAAEWDKRQEIYSMDLGCVS